MIVESLKLQNYRNYEYLNMNFDEKINIIYGDNAQGKTNILESMYVCATSKSHRGSKDREIIRFDNDESHIKLNVKKNDMNYRIDMHLKKNKPKGIAVNGIPIKRAVELFGILNIVFFSPEDLNIIKNGPSERRRFIDMELSQLDKIYLDCLINYNKVVNQRNSLLKEYAFSGREDIISSLDIWDMQLVKYGNDVIKSREKFVKEINDLVKSIHTKLSGDREQLEIIYEPCVKEQDFESELVRVRDRDLKFKCTNIGPHKDDMCFLINGMDVRKYGSQGQQRTAALSLKLAEIELVKQIIHDTPVLFLDDVLSELDSRRQNFLLDSIGNIQTMITCTGLDEFINNRFSINKIFKVVNGTVSSMEHR
ncbi:MAG: DNA replication/repair protein RecF [Lachnospira sp.]|nr:DNA replication/repair protein RecF [Lachnospira sp.]MBO6174683.1 DNA replication/repair protein RecF [Lachnospira sp.]